MSKTDMFRRYRSQRGVSLLGMLIFAVVVVAAVVIGMRVLPTALEFMAAKRAIERVVTTGATDPTEIRKSFDRFAAVDDIVTITGKDLDIERTGDNGWTQCSSHVPNTRRSGWPDGSP